METVMKFGVGLFHAQDENGFQSNIIEDIPKDTIKDDSKVHCTPKPLMLMEKLVKLFVPNDPKAVVLDPFAGTGTTLVAAQNLGRTYLGIDINPEYVTIAQKRLSQCNGEDITVEYQRARLL
jgi:site-specific DNA-methyltransferase (adenine-specific)